MSGFGQRPVPNSNSPITLLNLIYAHEKLNDQINKVKLSLTVNKTEPLDEKKHGDIVLERTVIAPSSWVGPLTPVENAFSESYRVQISKTRAQLERLRTSRDTLGDIINSLQDEENAIPKEVYARVYGEGLQEFTKPEYEFHYYWDDVMHKKAVSVDAENASNAELPTTRRPGYKHVEGRPEPSLRRLSGKHNPLAASFDYQEGTWTVQEGATASEGESAPSAQGDGGDVTLHLAFK